MELDSALWSDEPDWLQKKRQLATMLKGRFPKTFHQDEWLREWRQPVTNASTNLLNQATGFTALPLETAVNQYSEMLQENLMEKAINWQENQLNAAHLANIDGGQFIYVADNYRSEIPIVFQPTFTGTNPHNVIIVGANSQVVIQEEANFNGSAPTFAGTELLLGTNAQVTYRVSNKYHGSLTYQAIHAYQAHGSELSLELGIVSKQQVTTSLYSFLDGQATKWHGQVALSAQENARLKLTPVLDGFGNKTAGHLDLWTQSKLPEQLTLAKLQAGSGEPLSLSENDIAIASEDSFTSTLPADLWLRKINLG